jgi:hypothetical protein
MAKVPEVMARVRLLTVAMLLALPCYACISSTLETRVVIINASSTSIAVDIDDGHVRDTVEAQAQSSYEMGFGRYPKRLLLIPEDDPSGAILYEFPKADDPSLIKVTVDDES